MYSRESLWKYILSLTCQLTDSNLLSSRMVTYSLPMEVPQENSQLLPENQVNTRSRLSLRNQTTNQIQALPSSPPQITMNLPKTMERGPPQNTRTSPIIQMLKNTRKLKILKSTLKLMRPPPWESMQKYETSLDQLASMQRYLKTSTPLLL